MRLKAIIFTALIMLTIPSWSQQACNGQLHVSRVSAYQQDSKVHLFMHIIYSNDLVNPTEALYVSPTLKADEQSAMFSAMIFDGKSKQVLSRDNNIVVVYDEEYGQYNFDIEYITNYEDWMQGASLCFASELRQAGETKAVYVDCVFDNLQINSSHKLGEVPEGRRGMLKPLKPYKLALRTNLLLPLLNIGVAVPLGNRWSVGADWYTPWVFRNSDHKHAFQLQLLSLEGRYWLGSKHSKGEENRQYRLLGHSLGAFFATGKYDFERNYKGDQGEFFVGGVDYMYSMPIFRKRMHLELSLGVGFLRASAYEYRVYQQPGGKGYYEDKNFRKVTRYVGPIKASVALVLPLRWGKTKTNE